MNGRSGYQNQSSRHVNQIASKIKEKAFFEHDTVKLVDYAKEVAEVLNTNGARSSQLRKFHSYIARIWEVQKFSQKNDRTKENVIARIKMLQPLVSYTVGRLVKEKNKNVYSPLKEIIDAAVDSILMDTSNIYLSLRKFKDFYDSLIAYFVYFEKIKKEEKSRKK